MAQEVKVTSKVFADIRNPYTGKPMDVRMVVTGVGEPMFHVGPGEYVPQDPVETQVAAQMLWSRADGVQGMRTGPVKCAYTGEMLSSRKTASGFAYVGGFNPKLLRTREEFLHYAAMRNGKSPYPKPTGEPERKVEKVVRVEISAKRRAADRGVKLTDEAVDRAAASMQLHKGDFAQRASVSMSVPKKGRK